MAEVKMNLEELEAIKRESKERLKMVKAEQESHTKTKEELAAVKASKEVIRKTVTIYPKAQQLIETFRINEKDAKSIAARLIFTLHSGHRNHHDVEYVMAKELEHTRLYPENYRPNLEVKEGKETTEYINMDSVKQELREQAEQKVGDELSKLRSQVVTLKADSTTWKENSDKEWQTKVDGIIDKDNKAYNQLLSDFNDLKEDKDTRSTEQKLTTEIDTLKQQLQKIADRSWWKRVLNIS